MITISVRLSLSLSSLFLSLSLSLSVSLSLSFSLSLLAALTSLYQPKLLASASRKVEGDQTRPATAWLKLPYHQLTSYTHECRRDRSLAGECILYTDLARWKLILRDWRMTKRKRMKLLLRDWYIAAPAIGSLSIQSVPLYDGAITAASSTEVQRMIATLVIFFNYGYVEVTGNLDTQTVTSIKVWNSGIDTGSLAHTKHGHSAVETLRDTKGLSEHEASPDLALPHPSLYRWTSLPQPLLQVAHTTLM